MLVQTLEDEKKNSERWQASADMSDRNAQDSQTYSSRFYVGGRTPSISTISD